MESRDLGGDRYCPLQIHGWLISWVGSEHILRLHCEPQTASVAHRWGDTVESVSGRHRCLLMLTKLEMLRLIVQMLLHWVFCIGPRGHEASPLANPATIYTQRLWTLAKAEFESWVLMKQDWGIYLDSHCYLFSMLIAVLRCGKPAEQE